MIANIDKTIIICFFSFFLFSCATKSIPLTVNSGSVKPGSQITKQGKTLPLLGTPVQIGQQIPETSLVDAQTMQPVNLQDFQGSVLFISIIPSIDTKVCEE